MPCQTGAGETSRHRDQWSIRLPIHAQTAAVHDPLALFPIEQPAGGGGLSHERHLMSRQSAIAHRQFTSRLDLYLSVLLILVTALVYWRVTDYQFLNCYDHLYVTDKEIV